MRFASDANLVAQLSRSVPWLAWLALSASVCGSCARGADPIVQRGSDVVGAPRVDTSPPDHGDVVASDAAPSIGVQCAVEGERACADNGSRLAVRCSAGSWQMDALCAANEACSVASSDNHGTCQPIVAQCLEHALGQRFCAEGAVRSCADLVSFAETRCDERSACRADGDSARCACAPGYRDLNGTCRDVDECATGNGGCDSGTVCNNMDGGHTCGGCARGYLGGKAGVCTPALIDLSVTPGTLNVAFTPMQKEYAVSVPLTAGTVEVTATAPDGASLSVNDAAIESGKAWRSGLLPVGDSEIVIVVSRAESPSSTYKLVVTRGQGQDGYVKTDNGRPVDGFGGSLALSGDVLVVGAPGEDGSSPMGEMAAAAASAPVSGSGAAYVFQRDKKGWSQRAYLKADRPSANAAFGSVVAVAGDTIVVGAPGARPGNEGAEAQSQLVPAYGSGAAYVFVRDGEGEHWTQQAVLRASNAGAGDTFGNVLAISGDTIVVGAPREGSDATGIDGDGGNDAALASGAAYVFVRADGKWSQQAFLKAPVSRAGDSFGFSVAIDRDTIVVGAIRTATEAAPTGSTAQGTAPAMAAVQAAPANGTSSAVYVFARDGVAWVQEAELGAASVSGAAWFGYSVGVSGRTIVVGAPQEVTQLPAPKEGEQAAAPAAVASGAAHVFVRGESGWKEQASLTATQDPALVAGTAGDAFGASVKIVGDTILVGAYLEDSNAAGLDGDMSSAAASNSGAAYLFVRAGKRWSAPTYIKASNTRANDEFGRHTALSREGLAVGASNEDSGARGTDGNQADATAPNSGAVYVFR